MGVQDWNDENCVKCGGYHCFSFFCGTCLVKIAVKFGADKEKLIAYLKKEGLISDYEIKEFEEN